MEQIVQMIANYGVTFVIVAIFLWDYIANKKKTAENQETIKYLDNLLVGMFCTLNIPLYNNEKIPVTAMYIGKDKDGRYNFIDTGRFVLSKEFIEQKSITIDKTFDEDKAFEIYSKVRIKDIKNKKEKERENY